MYKFYSINQFQMQTRGERVKKSEYFADVIYGCSLTAFSKGLVSIFMYSSNLHVLQWSLIIFVWLVPQKLIAHRMLIDYITQTFMNTEITFGNIKQAKKWPSLLFDICLYINTVHAFGNHKCLLNVYWLHTRKYLQTLKMILSII